MLHQMEVVDRAERLQRVQREVSVRTTVKSTGPDEIDAVVKGVLTTRNR